MKKVLPIIFLLLADVGLAQDPWSREGTISTDLDSHAEFAFTRIIFESGYQPLPGPGGRWMCFSTR